MFQVLSYKFQEMSDERQRGAIERTLGIRGF